MSHIKKDVPAVRQPAVAGMFYPADRDELLSVINQYLEQATRKATTETSTAATDFPKAIIAPHAGYIYSGPVAASVYACVAKGRDTIRRVVLLGPSHRVPFYGCAVSTADYFATPLGKIELDTATIQHLLDKHWVKPLDQAHLMEHSLEVQLPFLQVVLNEFRLIPIVVGDASADEVSTVLQECWGGPETLIVISSDLSHYHDYQSARKIDLATCHKIEDLDYASLSGNMACGYIPVSGLLHLAQQRKMSVKTIDYRNSGDTAGPRDQVVGYGAYVIN